MGFTPAQVGEMSLWQFMACVDGWAKANSPEAAKRSNDPPDFGDVQAMFDAAPEFLP
ncbi:hypothetical protein ACFPOB_26195 [Bosea eneae]|uniref:Uncharacterized protein n=1 Tax=Bosea eneae TaxID=151454 RepID=A0ABW0J0V1_9HYPH